MTSSHALAGDWPIRSWFVIVTISCVILAFWNLACLITDVVADPAIWATWGTFLRFFRVMWAILLSIESSSAISAVSAVILFMMVTISCVILAFWNQARFIAPLISDPIIWATWGTFYIF